jgi:hypothetical protein
MPSSGLAVLALVALAASATRAAAQSETTSPASPRERASVALAASVALEGSGPWLVPGVRVAVPLGGRVAVDVEAARVFGGRSEYGSITSLVAVNVRFLRRAREADGAGRYWLAGARYYPITGSHASFSSDVAATFGHGWDQVFASGRRLGAEVGFSGGRGYLVFLTIVVGIPLGR